LNGLHGPATFIYCLTWKTLKQTMLLKVGINNQVEFGGKREEEQEEKKGRGEGGVSGFFYEEGYISHFKHYLI
jgi:hypothetical protein